MQLILGGMPDREVQSSEPQERPKPKLSLVVLREQTTLRIQEQQPPPREQCVGAARPCQWLNCRYHLWVNERRPGRRWEAREHLPGIERSTPETCALDVAEVASDGLSRGSVGKLLGISNERVRQIEESALAKLGSVADKVGLR